MVDLAAAIRATAEAARDQALAQVDADVAAAVEGIRSGSKEGEDALRQHADEDIAGIKEWSRAEIARIKEQTEAQDRGPQARPRRGARRPTPPTIEDRVGEVEQTRRRLSRRDDGLLRAHRTPRTIPPASPPWPSPCRSRPVLEALGDGSDLALDMPDIEIPAAYRGARIAEPEAEPNAEAEPVVEADAGEPQTSGARSPSPS